MFRKNAMLAGLMMASGVLGGVIATSITHVDAQTPANAPVTTTSLTIVNSSGKTVATLGATGLTINDAATGIRRTLVSQGLVSLYYDDGAQGPVLDVNGGRFNFPQAAPTSQTLLRP